MKAQPVQIGSSAPQISLEDQNNREYVVPLKNTVLFFYPKDDTPGCTLEAKAFSDLAEEFTQKGICLIGISTGDVLSKQKFCTKHKLNLTLLADKDHNVASAYGVYGEKTFMGRRYDGISRTTFYLKDGKISHVWQDVKPIGHAKEVLDYVN